MYLLLSQPFVQIGLNARYGRHFVVSTTDRRCTASTCRLQGWTELTLPSGLGPLKLKADHQIRYAVAQNTLERTQHKNPFGSKITKVWLTRV